MIQAQNSRPDLNAVALLIVATVVAIVRKTPDLGDQSSQDKVFFRKIII
jgi:hypothetical protein